MKLATWRGESLVKISEGEYAICGVKFSASCDGAAIQVLKSWGSV